MRDTILKLIGSCRDRGNIECAKKVDFRDSKFLMAIVSGRSQYCSMESTLQIIVLRKDKKLKTDSWAIAWESPGSFAVGKMRDIRLRRDILQCFPNNIVEHKEGSIFVEQGAKLYEFKLVDGQFVEKYALLSERIDPEAIRLYFLLEGTRILPSQSRYVSLRVGDTISFVPQNDTTKEAFDSGAIEIHRETGKAENIGRCMATWVGGNSFTFTRLGIVSFGLYYGNQWGKELEPTFIIMIGQ